MSQSAIREYSAKKMLKEALVNSQVKLESRSVLITPETNFKKLVQENPWLNQEKLVVKPDQLFGKRGKHGLVGLNLDYKAVQDWIKEKQAKKAKIGQASGALTHFIVEPFIPHDSEYYIAIKAEPQEDIIYFSEAGGIEVEENWDKVQEVKINILEDPEKIKLDFKFSEEGKKNKDLILNFIKELYKFYAEYNFTYFEINPFALKDNKIIPLDVVAKIDDTAAFESAHLWGEVEFPAPFGRELSPEEDYIDKLDAKSGSSLKLTLLNPRGKIWTMVAGGGASVIYADTISDLGFGKEMANYGEYSGDPSLEETYEYAKTVISLMTKDKSIGKKALIIGGGIANFTDVAKTFAGIIKALKDNKEKLQENKVQIYVRRGGPNYEEGLRLIKAAGDEIKVPIEVYGPETHMTEAVKLATNYIK